MNKNQIPQTSLDAYDSLDADEIRAIYKQILSALDKLYEATYEEIASHLGMKPEKIWKRMSELRKKEEVFRPGNRRPLKSGRNGYTWRKVSSTETNIDIMDQKLTGPSVSDYSKTLITNK